MSSLINLKNKKSIATSMTRIISPKPEFQDIVDNIYRLNQDHIFTFWDELSTDEQIALLEQVKTIDFELLQELVEKHIMSVAPSELDVDFEPCDVIEIPRLSDEREKARQATAVGERYLREGKVGIFLVAGGQGSRLGYDGPKGCFEVSPVKHKPIYQLFGEYIFAMQKKYSTVLPWYIMTSKQNHDATKAFFEEHDYFGLHEVHFFQQGMIPAVDGFGKLLLESRGKIFMNPDGHGGSISALKESGAIEDMKIKGLKYLFYFQVDNILAKIADPTFIGYHALAKAEMSTKAVEKISSDERVGVLGKINGKQGIIEYSVMPDELKDLRTSSGELKFKAGNIAIHMLNVDFLESLANEKLALPYFKAHKAISYVETKGEMKGQKIVPEKPNAYKFEKFIFDALKKTTSSVTMMVRREEEFAPVKNKTGTDSPETAKRLMSDMFKSWLLISGIEVDPESVVEISWKFALSSEELSVKLKEHPATFDYDREIYLE